MQRGGHAAAAPPTIVMTCAVQKSTAGQFHGVPSPAFAMPRAHAMGTDREIERLSEMPADSIAAATTKIGSADQVRCGLEPQMDVGRKSFVDCLLNSLRVAPPGGPTRCAVEPARPVVSAAPKLAFAGPSIVRKRRVNTSPIRSSRLVVARSASALRAMANTSCCVRRLMAYSGFERRCAATPVVWHSSYPRLSVLRQATVDVRFPPRPSPWSIVRRAVGQTPRSSSETHHDLFGLRLFSRRRPRVLLRFPSPARQWP